VLQGGEAATIEYAVSVLGVNKFETGQVFAYHPQDGQFVLIEGTSFAAPSGTRKLPPI
jgi:hypothetical protein